MLLVDQVSKEGSEKTIGERIQSKEGNMGFVKVIAKVVAGVFFAVGGLFAVVAVTMVFDPDYVGGSIVGFFLAFILLLVGYVIWKAADRLRSATPAPAIFISPAGPMQMIPT